MLRRLSSLFSCLALLRSSADGFIVPTSLASSALLIPPSDVGYTYYEYSDAQFSSLVLSVVNIGNIGSQVGDTIRSGIFGAAAVWAALFLVSVLCGILYTAVVMPGQVEGFEEMLKETSPEKYQELTSKLKEGETFMSRPDLVEELVEVGTSAIAEEGDKELKLVLERAKTEKEESGSIDMEKLGDDVKQLVGMTIEEYVNAEAEFEKNEFFQSVPILAKFMTETDTSSLLTAADECVAVDVFRFFKLNKVCLPLPLPFSFLGRPAMLI